MVAQNFFDEWWTTIWKIVLNNSKNLIYVTKKKKNIFLYRRFQLCYIYLFLNFCTIPGILLSNSSENIYLRNTFDIKFTINSLRPPKERKKNSRKIRNFPALETAGNKLPC